MFGPALYIVGALAFLGVHSSSALTPQQATSVCALLPDGENIANPVDCSQYYACSNGKAILNSCLGKNLFSKDDQSCVPADQAPCGRVDDPCTFMSDGYFVAVPNSCSEYYYCEGGVGVKSSCEKGLNFDQGNQACKYQSEYPCTETNPGDGNVNLCEVIRSGIYFGVASSCKAWQKCQLNGPSEIDDCPAPYVFNVDTQACDYKENTNCRQSQGGGGTGGPSLEGTPCEPNGKVAADPASCAGYYVCTNGKYAFGKCINALYFNPETNTCTPRLDAVNDCDRCQGTKLQFVNLYGDGCTGYGYCDGGVMKSKGKCANGYFSEVAGSCIQNGKNPEYPVCNVPEPTTEPSSSEEDTTVEETDSTTKKTTTKKTTTTEKTTEAPATETTETTKKGKTTTTEEPKVTEETKDPEETKDSEESKDPEETKDSEESKDPEETKDSEESKDPEETKDSEESKDPEETKDSEESKKSEESGKSEETEGSGTKPDKSEEEAKSSID